MQEVTTTTIDDTTSQPTAAPAGGPAVTIEGKQFGRGRALFPTWQMAAPAEWIGEDGVARPTLREFLAHVVRGEVAAFQERQKERSVIRALTAEQIAEGAQRGKIDAGGKEEQGGDVSDDEAVSAAVLAFQDGLYYVFVDDEQQEKLDERIALRDSARVTFLRLVALAGG